MGLAQARNTVALTAYPKGEIMNITSRLDAHRAAKIAARAQSGELDNEDKEIPNPDELEADETETTKSKKKDKEMTTVSKEEHDAAVAAAHASGKAEGAKETQARTESVMASEHYAGRETLAKTLLATGLSATEIDKALASAPKIEASTIGSEIVSQEAADAAARKVIQDAIGSNVNSAIDVSGGDNLAPNAKAESADVWAKAYGLDKKGTK